MKNFILAIGLVSLSFMAAAQDLPVKMTTSPTFSTTERFSNLSGTIDDGNGGVVAAMEIRPGRFGNISGYEFIHFDSKLKRIGNKVVKLDDRRNMGLILNKDQISIIEFTYDKSQKFYICTAQVANANDLNFTRKELFRLGKDDVNFTMLTKTEASIEDKEDVAKLYLSADKKAFAVCINLLKRKATSNKIFVFDSNLNLTAQTDFFREADRSKYWLKKIAVADDGKSAYVIGYKFEKEKKKSGNKYDFEITSITNSASKSAIFKTGSHYITDLQVIDRNSKPLLVGFYSDSDEDICEGVVTANLDPATLSISSTKYNLFSEQFNADNSSKGTGLVSIKELKVEIAENNDILINAEEEAFNVIGGSSSYSYGNIASLRLDEKGNLLYSRLINKDQQTTGSRNAYLSYYPTVVDNTTYIFINGKMEKNKDGNPLFEVPAWPASNNSGLYMIRIDNKGNKSWYLMPEKSTRDMPVIIKNAQKTENKQLYMLEDDNNQKKLLKIEITG